jgi:hypothetical protein
MGFRSLILTQTMKVRCCSQTGVTQSGDLIPQLTAGSSLATAPSTPVYRLLVADTQPNHEGMLLLTNGCYSSDFGIRVDVDALLIPTVNPLAISEFTLFLRLDSFTKPGISKVQFLALFARCLGCGKYMTRRAVTFHDCENFGDEIGFGENVVIDLTGDD